MGKHADGYFHLLLTDKQREDLLRILKQTPGWPETVETRDSLRSSLTWGCPTNESRRKS